jgi:hypothetical protein
MSRAIARPGRDDLRKTAERSRDDFNDYRDCAGFRLKSLEELEIFYDSFFNFRRKTVIMNLDFPRFDVGVRPAALWRVASRRVGKPRGKLNKDFLRFESARRFSGVARL